MIVFKTIPLLNAFLDVQRKEGKKIGFVPTMGALHMGHISLVQTSCSENDFTVCSIFVNPTQFNNKTDLAKYPRNTEADMKKLLEAGCEVLFSPDVEEMYPNGLQTNPQDYGEISALYEGAFRPGHFDGVIAIVTRLFQIVTPHQVYFGQKDYQQCMVVNELIKRNGFDIRMHVCPTQREADGLAMSSRNVRLGAAERQQALVLYEALEMVRQQFRKLPVEELKTRALNLIAGKPKLKPEYFEICHAHTLKPLNEQGNEPAVALVAAHCGAVRLIDNMLME